MDCEKCGKKLRKFGMYPACAWLTDRTIRKLRPKEFFQGQHNNILTGDELANWRKEKHLSLSAAARLLGINRHTIKSAESRFNQPLGQVIRRAFQQKYSPSESGQKGCKP